MRFTLRGTSVPLEGEKERVCVSFCQNVISVYACVHGRAFPLTCHPFPSSGPHVTMVMQRTRHLNFYPTFWGTGEIRGHLIRLCETVSLWSCSPLPVSAKTRTRVLDVCTMCTFLRLCSSFCSDRFTTHHSCHHYSERLSLLFYEKLLPWSFWCWNSLKMHGFKVESVMILDKVPDI